MNGNPRLGLGSSLPAMFTTSAFLQVWTVSPPPRLPSSSSPSFHSCPLVTFHGAGPLEDKPQISEHSILGPSQLLPMPSQRRFPPSLPHSDASAPPITSPVYTLHAWPLLPCSFCLKQKPSWQHLCSLGDTEPCLRILPITTGRCIGTE